MCVCVGKTGRGRDVLEGGGTGGPQRRLGRRLEEVADAVGGGYCRLQMPLQWALAAWGKVAGRWLGALEGGGVPPPLLTHPWGGGGGVTAPPPPPDFGAHSGVCQAFHSRRGAGRC